MKFSGNFVLVNNNLAFAGWRIIFFLVKALLTLTENFEISKPFSGNNVFVKEKHEAAIGYVAFFKGSMASSNRKLQNI